MCFIGSLTKKMEECGLNLANCRAKGGAAGFKVAVLGAAGGIGQPLAMLMKMNPLVSVLHLYDVVNTPGVTADISHMDTGAVVRYLLFIRLSKCASLSFLQKRKQKLNSVSLVLFVICVLIVVLELTWLWWQIV